MAVGSGVSVGGAGVFVATGSAVAVSVGDRILLSDLPGELQAGKKTQPAKDITSLRDLEATHIAGLLAREAYNYTKVADLLGISRTTLWRKMKEYNLTK